MKTWLGLALAVWWSDLLITLGKKDIPRAIQVGLDWRVLGFTLGVSVLTGLVFGLVPALHSAKTELTESLKEGRGAGGSARRNRVRGVLVVAELAIAVVLLVGAGLLIQSLWRLQHVSPGLQPQNILTFNVSLPDVPLICCTLKMLSNWLLPAARFRVLLPLLRLTERPLTLLDSVSVSLEMLPTA